MNKVATWSLRFMILSSLVVLVMSYFSFYKLSHFQNFDWKSKQLITNTKSDMTLLREYYYTLSTGDSLKPISLTNKINEINKVMALNVNELKKLFTARKYYEKELAWLNTVSKALGRLEQDNKKMAIAYLSGMKEEAKFYNKKATADSLIIIQQLSRVDQEINDKANLSLGRSLHTNVISGLSIIFLLLLTFPLIKYLKRSKELADEANRGKSQFLANMSHEIRTPLNGIIGTVSMLQSEELTASQLDNLDIVAKSSQHLLGLINDILDLSKIESGKLDVETVEFNLVEAIENSCSMMAPLISSKGLGFPIYICDSSPVYVKGDQAKLTQIMVNLLSNAAKYTPTGFISINLSAETNDGSNISSVKIKVKDTGVGIPKDKLDKIFEAFMQTDISDTRKYGGSGLGLTISRKMLQAMSGKISVKSKEGKGSEFTVDVPLTVVTEKNKTELQEKETQLISKPLIIVSAHEVLQKNLLSYAQKVHKNIFVANDTGEALELIKKKKITQHGTILIDHATSNHFDSEIEYLLENKEELKEWSFIVSQNVIVNAEARAIKNIKLSRVLWPYKKSQIIKALKDPALFCTKLNDNILQKPKKKTRPQETNSYNVLLVEDNLINQKVATLMMESAGHKITVANNGVEAVEQFEKDNFDIILMDCQMPVMGGCDATLEIRKIEKLKNLDKTTIIAMTADSSKKTKEECFEVGMDEFLTKPIQQEHLLKALRQTYIKIKAA